MRRFQVLCPWLADSQRTIEAAAARDRLGHGWLISGPRGIGKRNLAYVLADRLLNREIGAPAPRTALPEDIFASDQALAEGVDLHPDLYRLKALEDKRTIVVDQVRDVTAQLTLKPLLAGVKIVVIELAETMTPGAANALLKSLEEPTPNTYLFLLAERPGRLPATIRSRCQHLALKAPAPEATIRWLEQSGLATEGVPPLLLASAPLVAARVMNDSDLLSNYKQLYSDIKLLYEGKADPHATATSWQRGDPELALACLIGSLALTIRRRLVPERSNLVTDTNARLADNPGHGISTEALFAGLKMAENLREQIGRGINLELAFRTLLLGLEQPDPSRVIT
jgi:DNA polymerase-3 subunit delta'